MFYVFDFKILTICYYICISLKSKKKFNPITYEFTRFVTDCQ